jgi:hypothetical protein
MNRVFITDRQCSMEVTLMRLTGLRARSKRLCTVLTWASTHQSAALRACLSRRLSAGTLPRGRSRLQQSNRPWMTATASIAARLAGEAS